tara:strand:- start:232 stop:609 length:378 start_codon:yes stop_codon:yes gene_type:complete
MTNSLIKPYSNRITGLLESLIGTEDPDDMMLEIMDKLSDTVTPIPDLGNFYTFVYKAETLNETYDVHPLIAATEYTPFGFKGFSYHWNRMRNYNFNGVVGQLYFVNRDELDELRTIPYQKFVLNN